MTWLLSAFVTALTSILLAAAFALLQGSGLAVIPTPSPIAILAGQASVFALYRCVLAISLSALLARDASRAAARGWLGVSVLWLADARPRWLLGYAVMLGSVVWGTWPLLLQDTLSTALWGNGALLALAFTAAAIAPDAAWRLALPALAETRQ